MTLRPDAPFTFLSASPILGDVLRHTVLPILDRISAPLFRWAMFSPARATERFKAEFSPAMSFRPSQIGANAMDGSLMFSAVARLRRHYGELTMPVVIMAGEGDRIVFARRSRKLHACIPGSELHILKGVGHMLHHLSPRQVADAVRRVGAATSAADEPDVRAAADDLAETQEIAAS